MIPFSPPRIDDKIINEVVDTLRSGWITTGPKTKLFEKKITDFCGCRKTLCINSATAGLELILRWYGVKEGDEVILPVYTYCATANVVVHTGAKPVFVDINEDDFTISIKEIEKAITSKTKVIIPVDLGGMPCDYNGINDLVTRDDVNNLFIPSNKIQEDLGRILILSDSAHSMGAIYYNKKAGSLTDVSVFSFHAVKNLTTGEGGAIAFNLPKPFSNEELYDFFSIYSLHGQNKDAYSKTVGGKWRYDVFDAGYKANMTDVLASIGLVEIERYEKDTLVRFKEIFDKYSSALKKYKWAEIPTYEKNKRISSYHLYMLRIKGIDEESRDLIIQSILEKGVSVNVHYIPLSELTFYKKMGYKTKNYPVSFDVYSREITLPTYYDITDAQIEEVVNAVVSAVEPIIKK
jgi:dTDP-4-amino-4,6-dideoxygalactose transaminase